MTFTYADRAIARHFEADDSEDLTNQLNEYFHDLATRDVEAQVTVLAGPQIWCMPQGRVHAMLIVKSDVEETPYEDLGLVVHPG